VTEDGKAVDPRFLRPSDELQAGFSDTRVTPFGLSAGLEAKGEFDKHFQRRTATDLTPIFTPDDMRVIFSGQRPNPESGADSVQTYHGYFYLDHLISVDLQGSSAKTIYQNEGGTADLPFFLKNGNIAFHTWNLERMDAHMYVQGLADGMIEMPILGGRLQGPNMWGEAFEATNGAIVGMTGRRRGELSNFTPFVFDHTMGISETDSGFSGPKGFTTIPVGLLDEIGPYPDGFCEGGDTPEERKDAASCSISQLILDTSYLPDNRALVSYNPERTYLGEGEDFALNFSVGTSVAERQESAAAFLPKRLGVGVLDQRGRVETLLENPPGKMLRHPTWVGPRQHPLIQDLPSGDETATSVVHIADFPLWLSFKEAGNGLGRKVDLMQTLDQIVAVRVLRKISDGNACLSDERYLRMTNIDAGGLHPTALGMVDSAGYEQLTVPANAGGDGHGDVPLQEDGSIQLTIPANELLLFQGVNESGRVVAQHERVFSLPGGHEVQTSVRREHYYSQCASCHGVVSAGRSVDGMYVTEELPALMDFETEAAKQLPVDLTAEGIAQRELTFLQVVRPLLDSKCISCHAGEAPSGDLSLQAEYSPTGVLPPESWSGVATHAGYREFMKGRGGARSHNFSVSYSWLFDDDHEPYRSAFASEIEGHQPLAGLAPWDAGYQNLFRPQESGGWYYLNASSLRTSFGRAFDIPSNSSRSFLLEILTASDLDEKSYTGAFDHTDVLTNNEVRNLMAVIDVGFPFMARCDDKVVPEGPNINEPWGALSAE
jgi:hypothetical protein